MTLEKQKQSTLEKDVQKLKICFVCTGNTCRSPMAAALLNNYGGAFYEAHSCGIVVNEGQPINEKAVAALEKAGVMSTESNEYKSHTARQLNASNIASFDRIICVTRSHAMAIIQAFPEYTSRISCFTQNITDPFGQGQEVYDKCLDDIKKALQEIFLIDCN